uniref:Uncharacterized protein n=1 Tax=viral metagenome TaxID=1070528 RepID=A0A6M3LQN3_9ZZZZ
MLKFKCCGEWFKVDESGNMTQEKNNGFSGNWKFLGISFHHWRNGIDVHYHAKILPENIIGGMVWDLDCGTTRQWRGCYNGKLPRITGAYKEETNG